MDKVLELADKADDYADSKLQCKGEWHPDWHEVRDQYFYTLARADLEAEVEQLRVQLAGCGVAAMQNTVSSRHLRVVRGSYGYSESYADVCRAVDREIELREENAQLREQNTALDKACADLEAELLEQARIVGMGGERELKLMAENERLLGIVRSVEGMVSNCDVSSGVCCCGDSMENHDDPMFCGHTPVDSGWYAADSLLKRARAALGEK